ncbi:glycosyltransferase [Iningainema tapete]|uniref:Glycosyltransferase n=1 Tax=Iningainema tapete BLCC-T55 TaxID=2748662 RepID=A0A8J6XG83_9CYAN|nr:glycosyltransferase [Iningainema tapete]MBD2773618.1 glycosyltransferase [Iningainema tapete BLCC-T55]
MTITQFSSTLKRHLRRRFQLPTATLILLSTVLLSVIIVVGWFAGEDTISVIFAQIYAEQENPPLWLKTPMVTHKYLLAPTVALFLMVLGVMKVSPKPRVWSRQLVVGILIILTLRYFVWRSLSTLNLSDPLNGVFSLGLFFCELLMLLGSTIQLFLMLNVKDRRSQADRKSVAVTNGSFTPSVDILIPTYNEPVFIVRRTLIGCQALEYAHKKIYLLDDTRRPEMKQLACELGCEYITRADNSHAKAGNLNHALTKTNGELVVVFDADFIPTKNFLTRTVGFFLQEQVALVQTPQSFYNADPIARNLGLENILTSDEEVFYRQIQPIRDSAGSVTCCGTSFVVRRSALAAAGGFVTESLSEDYFTGIRISAQGYRLVYLNEKLSAGLAAESIAAYATQRLRWARGTLQAFFIKSNPLTIPGLSLIQRLAHLEGLLTWFSSISRVYFLLIPLAYSFLGVIPIHATPAELLYFFLPYYLVNLTVFTWLNHQSRSALLSDIYSIVLCFPLALTVIQVMLNPFAKGFKVTPKGKIRKRFYFNWNLALPLIILFAANAFGLWQNLGMSVINGAWVSTVSTELAPQIKGIGLGWVWSTYNLIMIGISLLILFDAPKLDVYEWFDLRRVVRLNVGEQSIWGVTTIISEVGAQIALTQNPARNLEDMTVKLEIAEESLQLEGQIVLLDFKNEFPTVHVKFESVSLSQHRRLVEMLFCRPGQWKRNNTPGEWRSLLLILRILLKPRILFRRNIDVTATTVAI